MWGGVGGDFVGITEKWSKVVYQRITDKLYQDYIKTLSGLQNFRNIYFGLRWDYTNTSQHSKLNFERLQKKLYIYNRKKHLTLQKRVFSIKLHFLYQIVTFGFFSLKKCDVIADRK